MTNKNIKWILICIIICFGLNKIHSQITEIDYFDWIYSCKFNSGPNNFIINSKDEFKELSNCILINYDFAKYTIIGIRGTSPGHFIPTIDIRIFKNEMSEKIIIEVRLSGGNSCNLNCRVGNPGYGRIVYTDKLDSDYEIYFDYIRLYE